MSVGTMTATDADATNGGLSYSITDGNALGIFVIDSATGEITVTDNTASGDSGGGIGLGGAGAVSIMKSTVTGNVAITKGGGIFRDATGTASLIMSKVSGNVASKGPQLYGPITVV